MRPDTRPWSGGRKATPLVFPHEGGHYAARPTLPNAEGARDSGPGLELGWAIHVVGALGETDPQA
jgi:hypothetical protein